MADEPTPRPPRWRPVLAVATIAVVVAGGLLVVTRPSGDDTTMPADSGPDIAPSRSVPDSGDTPLQPTATLPDSADVSSDVVPPTVLGTRPTDWYRLQPDLDVAWYSPNDGPSMLCLRTPVVPASCQPDEFAPTDLGGGPIGVATAGDQMIVVTLDPGDTITLTTTAGTEITVPVVHDPNNGWGIARISVADGTELTGLQTTYPSPPTTGVTTPLPSVPGLSGSNLPPGLADITTSVETSASRRFAADATDALTTLGWDAELREHATRTTRDGVDVQWVYFADGPDRRLFVVAAPPDLDGNWSADTGTIATRGDATRTVIALSEPIGAATPRTEAELASLLTSLT